MKDHDDRIAATLDEAILQLGRTTAIFEDLAARHRADHRESRQKKVEGWLRAATTHWSMGDVKGSDAS